MIVRRTTLRLTLTFTAIVLGFLAVAFVGVYGFASVAFDFDVITTDAGASNEDAVARALESLRDVLIIAYVAALVLVPVLSWFMARLALRPLRRSYEIQAQFVDATSHEFRTPLGILMGELSWAALRKRTVAEYQESIRSSLETVEGLAHLTEQLLLLSRDAGADLAEGRERLPLAEIAAEAADLASREHRSEARITLLDPADVEVSVSRDLMVSAVRNLVDNALKYAGPDGRVTIAVERSGGSAILTVCDNGPGLSRADAERAFERFWRAPATAAVKGHGMGLPLVRSIVEAHGGRVTLRSAQDGGTVATVTLDAV